MIYLLEGRAVMGKTGLVHPAVNGPKGKERAFLALGEDYLNVGFPAPQAFEMRLLCRFMAGHGFHCTTIRL